MEYPPELKKKITLYKHFYKYFKSKKLKQNKNYETIVDDDNFLDQEVQVKF